MRYLSLIVAIVLFSLPVSAAQKTSKSKKSNKTSLSDEKIKAALDKKIPAIFNNIPLSEVCKKIQTTSKLKVSKAEDICDNRNGWLEGPDGVQTPIHIEMDTLLLSTRDVLSWVAALHGGNVRAVLVGELEIEFQIVENPDNKKWEGRLIEEPKFDQAAAEGKEPAKEEPVKKGSGKKSPAKKK